MDDWKLDPRPHNSEEYLRAMADIFEAPEGMVARSVDVANRLREIADSIESNRDAVEKLAKKYREALGVLSHPLSFHVGSGVGPEGYARMKYADYILNGLSVEEARRRAEDDAKERAKVGSPG